MVEKIYNKWWFGNFKQKHSALLDAPAYPEKIRLILGTARSGTTWISKVISQSHPSLRFFEEPLYHVSPKLRLSYSYDHTAIPYRSSLTEADRLGLLYQQFAKDHPFDDTFLTRRLPEVDSPEPEFVLIKEVHSLLATEGLLPLLDCPTVMIRRNPIYIIDSLFAAQTLETIYFIKETDYVQEPEFLEKYGRPGLEEAFQEAKKQPHRQRRIVEKLLTALACQDMFTKLGERFPDQVLLIDYEEACVASIPAFRQIMEFFGMPWSEEVLQFLESINKKPKANDPYSIQRDTKAQLGRSMKFLTDEEVTQCQRVMDKLEYTVPTF